MKDKQMIVLVDDEFLEKVEYLRKINNFKNKSDTVRKTIEKEYRKEHLPMDNLLLAKWDEEWHIPVEGSGRIMPVETEPTIGYYYPRGEAYCKACPYLNTLECRIYGKGMDGEVGCTLDSRK